MVKAVHPGVLLVDVAGEMVNTIRRHDTKVDPACSTAMLVELNFYNMETLGRRADQPAKRERSANFAARLIRGKGNGMKSTAFQLREQ
jgi:hypothetical protein